MDWMYGLFGIIVLVSHFIEGITGFGCTILALPFCIALVGVKTSVPVLVILSFAFDLIIALIDYRRIKWKEMLVIFAFVIAGMPFGFFFFNNLPDRFLEIFLGIFMIVVAVAGLIGMTRKGAGRFSLTLFWKRVLLFVGGIVHGAFGASGPFMIAYAKSVLQDKTAFRATMATLWVVLNAIIIVQHAFTGMITPEVFKLAGISLPFIGAGLLLGNMVHKKVSERSFSLIVYIVLLISGVFTMF